MQSINCKHKPNFLDFPNLRNALLLCIAVLLCVLLLPVNAQPPSENLVWQPSIAYQWIDIALEGTARDVVLHGARPTVGSRALAIVSTAIFDAWAAYDDHAVGTRFGDELRRPSKERTSANKRKAISYAAFRTLVDVYPEATAYFTQKMQQMGFNPSDTSTNKTTAQGIGNLVAGALVNYYHQDGANQMGDEVGSNGQAYSDYTFYSAINTPDKITDPNHWQPIEFSNKKILGFLTPHWYRVKTFVLERPDQFRPAPPPLIGSKQLDEEVQQVIDFNANLTWEQKALVEFMRDGPSSTGQSGHWLKFAQDVSVRDHHTLDQDVKMFFAIANTAKDAFIASWDAKRAYDTSRPWTLIHHYFAQKTIQGWGGPGKGTIAMNGESWHPYSPSTFITPPFPGYVFGHSTVSAACAEILRLFTGSDRFGESVVVKAGALTEPGFEHQITLTFPTFTATAEAAGLSRIYGGYHIQSDNVEGLKLGRKVAEVAWEKALLYFEGEG